MLCCYSIQTMFAKPKNRFNSDFDCFDVFLRCTCSLMRCLDCCDCSWNCFDTWNHLWKSKVSEEGRTLDHVRSSWLTSNAIGWECECLGSCSHEAIGMKLTQKNFFASFYIPESVTRFSWLVVSCCCCCC